MEKKRCVVEFWGEFGNRLKKMIPVVFRDDKGVVWWYTSSKEVWFMSGDCDAMFCCWDGEWLPNTVVVIARNDIFGKPIIGLGFMTDKNERSRSCFVEGH